MVHTVTHFLATTNPFLIYGLAALFLLLESSGIPIVNSTLLLLVGALCSTDHFTHLNIGVMWFFAVCGSIAGALLAYTIGRRGGMAFLRRVARLLHMREERLLLIERWGRGSGPWMIFFSRMIPYIRPFACFPAGIARMPRTRFLLAATCGSLIWCSALLALGWFLGRQCFVLLRYSQHYTLPLVLFLLLVVVSLWLTKRWLQRRLNTRWRAAVKSEQQEQAEDLLHA